MFSFAYFVPVPHMSYIYKKMNHRSFIDPITLNSASSSQKTVYNNSIFRKNKLYFTKTLRYHEGSYITFNRLIPKSVGLSKILPWGILFDKSLYSPKVLTKNLAYPNRHQVLFLSVLNAMLRLVLHLILTLRKVLQSLVTII
jgi:hypothetical protein